MRSLKFYFRDSGIDEAQRWNHMKATDIFSPRVFLCKASRFLQNLHGDHLDPDYDYGAPPERDTFGSDDFTRSCDPNDFEEKPRNEDNNLTDDVSDLMDDYSEDSDPGIENLQADPASRPGVAAEIVEVRIEPETRSIIHMPILVFEGMFDKIHLFIIILGSTLFAGTP